MLYDTGATSAIFTHNTYTAIASCSQVQHELNTLKTQTEKTAGMNFLIFILFFSVISLLALVAKTGILSQVKKEIVNF